MAAHQNGYHNYNGHLEQIHSPTSTSLDKFSTSSNSPSPEILTAFT